MIAQDLTGEGWFMRAVGDFAAVPLAIRGVQIPARVPGCVHTDLIRASLIGDPRIGFNERDGLWIGEADWEYRTEFRLGPEILAHQRLDLVCECLDTIAEVSVNEQRVGSAANMFHPHRFDLRGAAREGENELAITFRSPLRHIRTVEARLGKRPVNGDWDPYIFIRKAACNFGWDWAPKVPTCGVCGPIRVEAWSGARVAAVRPLTRRDAKGCWALTIHVNLDWPEVQHRIAGLLLGACLRDDRYMDEWDSVILEPGQTSTTLQIDVEKPRLWWPRELGEQFLHSLDLVLYDTKDAAGANLPREPWGITGGWNGHVGFRNVRLNTDPDQHGESFQIEINGKPVFCKGANWIPEGLFPDDRPDENIRHRVRQAAAANMNMLRVWGGGMYESEAFYDECDKQGIMIWQDFMFACACYPEEAPYPQLVEAEARHQIARLSSHPSVVLWCGGNECVWGYESWGYAATDFEGPWKKRVWDKSWGGGYFYDLLPRLMRELDPTRPYWPNSPFAGRPGENPNQTDRGDRHTWDVSVEGYRAIVPRFCAEFGHQSPPSLELLNRVLRPEDLEIGSPGLEQRQRAKGGTARHINEHLAKHYPTAQSFEEWHRQAQEMQARALVIGIDTLAAARQSGRCMGSLIWQFNDAWPGMSWSLIDSEGTPKPAYHAVREAFAKIGE